MEWIKMSQSIEYFAVMQWIGWETCTIYEIL